MTPSDLIVKTAHGATIQRTEDGQFWFVIVKIINVSLEICIRQSWPWV